jgi:hypothetical protein
MILAINAMILRDLKNEKPFGFIKLITNFVVLKVVESIFRSCVWQEITDYGLHSFRSLGRE